MKDEKGNPHYPFDEWIGLRKSQRYSPLVEVKTAELVSESTYRAASRTLKEWTPVTMSHGTVGDVIKRVREAQAQADKDMSLNWRKPHPFRREKKLTIFMRKQMAFFSVQPKKRKAMRYAMRLCMKDGLKMASGCHSKISVSSAEDFWKEVQADAAHHYSLENTQVVTNSDGGQGYTAEKFQEAFSQSRYPVLNQLDSYHIAQGLNRALGSKKSSYKDQIRKALKQHDWDQFTLWLDTYESTLEDKKQIEKINEFRTYINHNWDRIFDWREKVENPPEDARGLGAMESNISFRMKRRGMHWSSEGSEAMVEVKQGMINNTLRDVYLRSQERSARKQREVKKIVRTAQFLREVTGLSIGAKQGSIALYTAHSSSNGESIENL